MFFFEIHPKCLHEFLSLAIKLKIAIEYFLFQCNSSDPNTNWSLLLAVLVCLLHVPDEPTDRTNLESANSHRCKGVLGKYITSRSGKYFKT